MIDIGPLGRVNETASPPAVKCSGERWEVHMENKGKEENENRKGKATIGCMEVSV